MAKERYAVQRSLRIRGLASRLSAVSGCADLRLSAQVLVAAGAVALGTGAYYYARGDFSKAFGTAAGPALMEVGPRKQALVKEFQEVSLFC